MTSPLVWLVLGLLVISGNGCTGIKPAAEPKLRVVLLPQNMPDGQPRATAVEIRSGSAVLVLDKPFAVAERNDVGQLIERTASAAEIQARYAAVLKMEPPSPETLVLRFLQGTSKLTQDSEADLPKLIEMARSRAGGEILVVGHTDRLGTVEANDALSLKRAQAIVDLLTARGFARDLITASGRGKREPLVPTADEVAEPRNRRVEVTVR